jgi:hypothetical protein
MAKTKKTVTLPHHLSINGKKYLVADHVEEGDKHKVTLVDEATREEAATGHGSTPKAALEDARKKLS